MKPLIYQGATIAQDPEGFLLDLNAWCPELVPLLAQQENIILTEAHWQVIYFLREYYQQYQHFPLMRIWITLLKEKYPQDPISTQWLYELFPSMPLKQAARLAGLPKPPHCT